MWWVSVKAIYIKKMLLLLFKKLKGKLVGVSSEQTF